MSLRNDLIAATEGMSAQELLRYLLKDRFPGRTVVTASLRARSVVVLKLVADIDPATPVRLCHAGELFPESRDYRDRIVAMLGLRDVREPSGHEIAVLPADRDHVEVMWAEYRTCFGKVQEIFHLNETLAGFDCWISAVYHCMDAEHARIDSDGRLIRVDPLVGWGADEVRAFMSAHGLPLHPRYPAAPPLPPGEEPISVPTHHY